MAIRDKMAANARPHLHEGETIHAIFGAQTVSPYWSLLSFWIIVFSSAYRVVVVTDKRILVCRAGRFATSQVNEVLHELPRSIVIGPARGIWYPCQRLGDKRLYIHRRYHKDVKTADSLGA